MKITEMAHIFHNEAINMENFYNNSQLLYGLINLYFDHHITDEDLNQLPENIQDIVLNFPKH